jgi:hypothetical protein
VSVLGISERVLTDFWGRVFAREVMNDSRLEPVGALRGSSDDDCDDCLTTF